VHGQPSADPPAVAGSARVPRAPVVLIDRGFTIDDLYAIRVEITTVVETLGSAPELLERVLIVASELTANAIRHAGGRGRLVVTIDGPALICRVSDNGSGIADPDAGRADPPVLATGGRGLWLCRRFADTLDISTASSGTTVTAAIRLAR
jgi:anti-sigma regulatory factor (Ser/Thr protein kinase)